MSEGEVHQCMYYPDLVCPVQKRLKEFSLIDSIEPLKEDNSSTIARAMKSAMTASTFILQCLATFCSSCPHLRRKTYEDAMDSAEKLKSLGPAEAVPIPRRSLKEPSFGEVHREN